MNNMHDADDVITTYLSNKAQALEQQILEKGELLDLFMNVRSANGNVVGDQIAMVTQDLEHLIEDLLKIRRDSEFTSPKTQGIIDRMGNIKTIGHERLLSNLKHKYLWQD